MEDEMIVYSGNAAADQLLVNIGTGIAIAAVVTCVLMLVGMWKVFAKTGEDGWKALIPFYSSYVLYDISRGNGWYFLLTLIPLVGFVFHYIMLYKLCQTFSKSTAFFVGMLLLQPIFLMILGFDDSVYSGPEV